MELNKKDRVLKFSVQFKLKTPLMLRSGNTGEFADSEIERTPDKKQLHVNGYVWASLLKRAMNRLDKAGKELAATIGDYPTENISNKTDKINNKVDNAELNGVSPVWFESSFADIVQTEIRPGIRIDRQYGSTSKGALFNDEILSSGHSLSMDFNWFYSSDEKDKDIKDSILSALLIVDDGVETIGGGWSYGFGRLQVLSVKSAILELTKADHRKKLFKFDNSIIWEEIPDWKEFKKTHFKQTIKDLSENNYKKIKVKAKIADGQLLSISSNVLPLHSNKQFADLPDSFVYRTSKISIDEKSGETKPKSFITITGKAIRQALFSVPIERKLRSINRGKVDADNFDKDIKACMEMWFGSTEYRGIISIADAAVTRKKRQTVESSTEKKKQPSLSVVLNRIQLCEHSLQNNNLFAGEYLRAGEFSFDIILDHSNSENLQDIAKLETEIKEILEELKIDNNSASPPGWHRLGTTSTCTGQIEVLSYK